MLQFLDAVRPFNKVYVQGHDFPDTDSVASTFVMGQLCEHLGKDVELIYAGPVFDKPILRTMVSALELNIRNVPTDFVIPDDELLIMVDCQYGARNVTKLHAKNVMAFDHHEFESTLEEQGYLYFDIQPKLGSCSTLIYEYFKNNNGEVSQQIAEALLLGLYIDTNNLTSRAVDLDRQMSKELSPIADSNEVSKIMRTSYTQNDLLALTECITRKFQLGTNLISFIGDHDNNLVGQLSDFLCEIEGINNVILISEKPETYRISVRSYSDLPANIIINTLVKDVGGGGGDSVKAAGSVSKESYFDKFANKPFQSYILEAVANSMLNIKYLDYSKDDLFSYADRSQFIYARKKSYNVRFIDLAELFGTSEGYCSVETLEGKVQVPLSEIIIIGVKGEIYPVSRQIFKSKYKLNVANDVIAMCDNYLDVTGISIVRGVTRYSITRDSILKSMSAKTADNNEVIAVFTEEPITIKAKYGSLTSTAGCYIIMREDGEYYICDDDIFQITYMEIGKDKVSNSKLIELKEGVTHV